MFQLLFATLIFIILNLWIYLLWTYVSTSHLRGKLTHHHQGLFPLKNMLEFISKAIAQYMLLKKEIHLIDDL